MTNNKLGYETILDKGTIHEKKFIHIGYTISKTHQIVLAQDFTKVDKDSVKIISVTMKWW